jgi:hypothetical protein
MSIYNDATDLGLGGTLSLLGNVNLIPHKNAALASFITKNANFGTLKNPNHALVAEKQIEFFNDSSNAGFYGKVIWSNQKLPSDIYYRAFSEFFDKKYGELESFKMNLIHLDFFDQKFYGKMLKLPASPINNTDPLKPYARFSFPRAWDISNTNVLSGYFTTYKTPNINNPIINSLEKYNNFVSYSGAYIAYPQTIFQQTYPKYNVPTKLVRNAFLPNAPMNGLLILSTGNPEEQKIVYVSPHSIRKQFFNTIVENIEASLSKTQRNKEITFPGYWLNTNFGDNRWIAVGGSPWAQNTRDIAVSRNGKDWQIRPNILPQSTIWGNIAYGTGRWITLPTFHNVSSPKGATSINSGETWSEININGTNNGQYFPMTQFKKIVFNGSNRWVILGRDSSDRTLTSTDGVNWSGNASLAQFPYTQSDYRTLVFGNNKWITLNAVAQQGGNQNGMYSDDGINWQPFVISSSANSLYYTQLHFAQNRFVALPNFGNKFATSTNGTTWSFITVPFAASWGGLTHNGKEWIAIPSTYSLNISGLKSSNGINWTGFELSPNRVRKSWFDIKSNVVTGENETTVMVGYNHIRRLAELNYEYRKVVSGITILGYDINSIYNNSGFVFPNLGLYSKPYTERLNAATTGSGLWPKSGYVTQDWIIQNPQLYTLYPNLTTQQITEQVNQAIFGYHLINNDIYKISDHLKQITPIKDTWFYKLYNGVYTERNGNKTFNTGTWNGIIPSGAQLFVEYLSTNEDFCGTNNEFLLVHDNYGSNSVQDVHIKMIMMSEPYNSKKTFYSTSFNSLNEAFWKNKLKYRKYQRNSYIMNIRKFLPELVNYTNKDRRIKRFIVNKLVDHYFTGIKPGLYDYYSIYNIPLNSGGCFKLSNNEIYCKFSGEGNYILEPISSNERYQVIDRWTTLNGGPLRVWSPTTAVPAVQIAPSLI